MPIIKSTDLVDGQDVTIYVEVDEDSSSTSPYEDLRDASQVISAVRDVFGEGLELVRSCATRVVDKIQQIDEATKPDEFQVQLAIKLGTEVGAILAKMGSEAQMQVTMKWMRKDKE